jgi:hypothetical protein
MIGVITGRRVGKNRDGDKDVLILQVELLQGEDTRSIELFTDSDFNPANGTRICVIDASSSYQIGTCVSDGLTPEVDPGEKEIYSTDNPVTQKKARAKFGTDGIITLNKGTDFAVRYSKLESEFNKLKTSFNNLLTEYKLHTHPYVDTPIGPSTTSPYASTQIANASDITLTKVDTVMLP